MAKTKKVEYHNGFQLRDIVLTVGVLAALMVFLSVMGYPLVITLLLFFVGLHLKFFQKAKFKILINLGFLLALVVFATNTISHYTELSFYFIPVAAVGMLTMLLYGDLQLTFLTSFVSSVIVTYILGMDQGTMIMFASGGLTGAFAVKDARNRGQLINAGFLVGLVHVVCLMLIYPDPTLWLTKSFLMEMVYPLAAVGLISAFFVMATLKIFEYLFGVLTNFSLLELSDFNQPILKRLVLEAPGTYHHSLVVGNLTEAAADAIGANALLSRVGAYYHDIGKLVKPEYFTENQIRSGNKHDAIEPSVSRLVILNHVRDGIELARKHKLNPMIIDFIPQHHGTSLIHYFYQKSVEEAGEGETVNEAAFRYPGPKPQTRETAITLLADSVEGATRALDDPNPVNIEETVKKVINNKFIDGQLDECNLTLKEIDKISSSFTRILSAMYHGRIKYPEKKNGHSEHAR